MGKERFWNCLCRMAGAMAVAASLASGFVSTAHAQTSLRIAVESTPGDPLNIMLATFRDELQKLAGNAVAIEFFDGGSLGDETALMEMIQVNQVQIVPLGSDVVQLDSSFSLFDTPFLFGSKQVARDALDGEVGELLAASLRDKANLQVLAFGELGFRVISNNVRPINEPSDLQGLKIRTPGSQTRILAFTMLGAAPTPMPLGEAYVALRQGALDGQENPLSVVEEFSFYEVQKYISLTNHVYSPITLSMNGEAWDALDDDLKGKLTEAAQFASVRTREVSDQKDAELLTTFKDKGLEINEPNLATFQEAALPIKDEIAKIVTPEIMSKVEEALK